MHKMYLTIEYLHIRHTVTIHVKDIGMNKMYLVVATVFLRSGHDRKDKHESQYEK